MIATPVIVDDAETRSEIATGQTPAGRAALEAQAGQLSSSRSCC
jgi:hypothetical protein